MSDYETQIGLAVRVSSHPFWTYDELHDSGKYDELRKEGIMFNYKMSICFVLTHDDYGIFEGFHFFNEKEDDAIKKLNEFGITYVGSFERFVCSWYNGCDNPLCLLSVNEFEELRSDI